MGITIIEHKDLLIGSFINYEEFDLAMFRNNEQNENLLKKMQVPESVFITFNLNVICLIIFIIFE